MTERNRVQKGHKAADSVSHKHFLLSINQLDPRSAQVAAITKAIPLTPSKNCIQQDQCMGFVLKGMVFVLHKFSLSSTDQRLFPSFILCLLYRRHNSRPSPNCGAAPCLPACTHCLECQTCRETTATRCQREVMFL